VTTPVETTLAELLESDDEDSATEALLTDAAARGLPTTSWADDSFPLTLMRLFGRAKAGLAGTITDLAKGGLLALSSGSWLDLLSPSQYGTTRRASSFAVVRLRLTVAPGQGPHTITANQLWVRRLSDNRRWNSTNAGSVTLTDAAPVDVDFRAESPGSRWSALVGQVIDLVTPLPGLSAAFVDAGAGSPVVTAGADAESDPTLRARCSARWDTIGVQKTADAYRALALSDAAGAVGVTRVIVNGSNPRGNSTVDVWLSADDAPAGSADVTAVNAYLQPRKSPSTDLQVAAATPLAVTIVATLEHDAGADPVPAALDAVRALLREQPTTLYRSAVAEALLSPSGARNVVLSTFTINGVAADLARAANQVLVEGTFTITGQPL
jgi:uncharacterized phage protein gp47/JayE